MSLTFDAPPKGITLEEDLLGGFGGFPDRLFLISVGGDRYACNNATLSDGQSINGLACFPSADDATTYMGLLGGLSGEIVGKTFEEAREIAIGKPVLSALFLFQGQHIVEVHYIR
jgi:hypothetical protein